ncbi:MAG TPA: hypothetical protein VGF43_24280, partial [Dongiaceae bacterium]
DDDVEVSGGQRHRGAEIEGARMFHRIATVRGAEFVSAPPLALQRTTQKPASAEDEDLSHPDR